MAIDKAVDPAELAAKDPHHITAMAKLKAMGVFDLDATSFWALPMGHPLRPFRPHSTA